MVRNRPNGRPKMSFYLPIDFFFQHPQFRRLVVDTLFDSQIKARGYFDPARVAALLTRMGTREFIYLKQVMSLVILGL